MEQKSLGEWIAQLRKSYGMTQRELAERMHVSDKAVSRWERNKTAPDLSAVPALAELFHVTADELLHGGLRPADESGDAAPTETQRKLQALMEKSLRNIRKIENEPERISAIYDLFNEETRLTRTKAARVEMLTTVRTIERHLRPGMKILELGAGTGEYSLYFARKGYSVTALDIADSNLQKLESKIRTGIRLELCKGDARDLSAFAPESFDIVLVLGPLYHMESEDEGVRCAREALRVCKPGGFQFFAFISNDMVVLTEFACRPRFFAEDSYDHQSFHVKGFPFYFHTVEEAEALLRKAGVRITRAVAADGVSELMADRINALDDADYEQYLRYHFYCCEKRELLGHSNHLLFVGQKPRPAPAP